MKINYIAYLDPYHHNGGGEMVTRALLEASKHRGHDVRIMSCSPRMLHADALHSNADITLLADIFNCPDKLRKFPEKKLENIVNTQKFVHFDNSYVDCCNLGYLPCSGKKTVYCKHKSAFNIIGNVRRRDFSNTCFQNNTLVQRLYSQSALNVFVSPLHQRTIHSMLGLEDKKYFILKPIIDTKKFYDEGIERDIEFLFVGAIGEAKGLENVRREFRDKDIHFVGHIMKGVRLDFGTYHNFVPYDTMPRLFNRAKNFVFKPRWPEPQGRVVIEAALCGCNLITNENVGATSFDFDITQPSNLHNAENEFWDCVEKI